MPPKRRRVVVDVPSDHDSDVAVTGSQVSPSRRGSASKRVRGGGTPRQSKREPLVPEAFQALLSEDSKRGWTSGSSDGGGKRITKRRKGKEKESEVVEISDGTSKEEEIIPEAAPDVEDEDEDEESDIDWEDVDLSAKPMNLEDIMRAQAEAPPSTEIKQPGTLELTLTDPAARKAADPRRKITAVERRIRLETHKVHLICLLYHSYLRSCWCNNLEVHANLRPLIPKTIYDKLHHDPTDQQYRRATYFLDGLREAVAIFQKKFKITHRGLSAPIWQDLEALKKWSPPRGTELIPKDAFIKASKTLSGSRDLGAQLFCALLRSAGITTRLVCSLQVLPFDFATKQKPPIAPTLASISNNSSASTSASASASSSASPAPRRTGGLRRPLLRTPIATPKPKSPAPKPELPPESGAPVVWVEAWSIASQRWITIDPLVTGSVARPQNLEPTLSDPLNTLSYAIAFEDTGHAVDVTRRYAKWFSAKTRRRRVTSTKGGEKWYKRLLRKFRRGFELDRDQIEQAEFSRLQLQEPVPNAVQDLKDHPLFALKRHLRRNEVIHPERKVGTVKTAKGGLETIFRREDVKEVRTQEQWYKVGRMVKKDEMPLKFTTARKMKKREEDAGEEEESLPNQPMFSVAQTEVYTPPPVVSGIVPKNKFGNLDVFVPTMVPPGGVHIPHPLARNAARIVDVDYADAVAGFEFRNRMASPVFKGVVVAEIYKEAIEAVVEGLEYEKEREEQWERARDALRLWRRWILRLRIRQRLGVGTDEAVELRLPGEVENRMEGGGGARSKGKKVAATRKTRRRVEEYDEEEEEEEEAEARGGGFLADSEEEGGFVRGDEQDVGEDEYTSRANEEGSYPPTVMDTEGGGGFLPEDCDDSVLGRGGGFIAEAEDVGSGFIPDDVGGGFVCEQDAPEVHLRPEENDEDGVPESAAEYLGGEFVCEQDAPEVHLHTEECPNAEDIRGGGFLPDADAREATPVAVSSEAVTRDGAEDGGVVGEANETMAQEVSSSQEKQKEDSYDEPDDEDEEDLDWELYGL